MTEIITAGEYKHQHGEHKLQVLVLDVVASHKVHPDIVAFAIPNAARRSLRMGARMKAEGLLAGVSDLVIMLPCGRTVWLEMKTPKGRQTTAQRAFEMRCRRLGHPYAVAHSVDEAIVFLKSAGVLK